MSIATVCFAIMLVCSGIINLSLLSENKKLKEKLADQGAKPDSPTALDEDQGLAPRSASSDNRSVD